MGKLTALQVKNAKPGRHADGNGLYLLVKPSGARSWVLRVQVGGRRRDFGLGATDLVSLQEAREKARESRKAAKAGLDPTFERKRALRLIPTFKEVAEEYHQTVKAAWKNGKHTGQWLTTLDAYAFPMIGSVRVDHVDAPTIQSVLMPIWLAKPETARRVRQRIISVLDFAHAKGWRDTEAPRNAVNALLKRLKQPKAGPGFAAIPYTDLPALMTNLREADPTSGRLALRFLILTAVRSGEVRGATWSEIDFEKTQWKIPAARMKAGDPHVVPLPPEAMEVLRSAREFTDGKGDGLLFPGMRKGQVMSDATMAKALKLAGGGGFTVHGMRSAFRDWVAERTSFPGDWAEAALAHTLPSKVEAAYKRTKFVEQRRALMEAWAAFASGSSNAVQPVGHRKG